MQFGLDILTDCLDPAQVAQTSTLFRPYTQWLLQKQRESALLIPMWYKYRGYGYTQVGLDRFRLIFTSQISFRNFFLSLLS